MDVLPLIKSTYNNIYQKTIGHYYIRIRYQKVDWPLSENYRSLVIKSTYNNIYQKAYIRNELEGLANLGIETQDDSKDDTGYQVDKGKVDVSLELSRKLSRSK